MRIALVQLDPVVGDLAGNVERIASRAAEAAGRGTDLVVLPELCLVGYPPLDLLGEPAFVERAATARADLVRRLGPLDTTVIFGTIAPSPSPTGKALQNVAVVARGGKEVAVRAKTLLPSYDVFDEDRWFAPADSTSPVSIAGRSVAVTICEDAWNDEVYWPQRVYDRDPVAELVNAGAEIVVNVAASPYHRRKGAAREAMLSATALRHQTPLLFVNQVGGNDELIFDGRSTVIDSDGVVRRRASRFKEDCLEVELPGAQDGLGARAPAIDEGSVAELRRALALGTRDYVEKCGFPGVLVGLSGGIDSAVVTAIAVDALGPDRVEVVLMPSRFTSSESGRDALQLAANLGIRARTIPIESLQGAFLDALAPSFTGLPRDVTEENIQARIRGVILMALSNKLGSLVLSTGNKSELAVGYCTLYGDMTGGLAVLGDCYKGWVRELAENFNAGRQGEVIPRHVIDRPPSAELRADQADEDDLPPYAVLDEILEGLLERGVAPEVLVSEGLPGDTVRRVSHLLARNEYKRRQAAPSLRVTHRAFGQGRSLPIARGGLER